MLLSNFGIQSDTFYTGIILDGVLVFIQDPGEISEFIALQRDEEGTD